MWYPASITAAPTVEPVSLSEAKAQLRVEHGTDDTIINRLIASARSHVEAYCAARFATQTLSVACDGFSDFARLSEAPVKSVSTITYVDPAGDTQTLSSAVYDLRFDGLEASIVLKQGQSWPAIRPGSRVVLTAVVGYAAVPEDVRHAILLLIGHFYENRESSAVGVSVAALPFAHDALLCNHRRGI